MKSMRKDKHPPFCESVFGAAAALLPVNTPSPLGGVPVP